MKSYTLPWPPTINHYYNNARGRVFIGAKGKAYRDEVILRARTEKWAKHRGGVEVNIVVYPPDKRKRDVDNLLKCLLDALQHADIIEDDNLINKLCIEKKWPYPPDGMVQVDINGD